MGNNVLYSVIWLLVGVGVGLATMFLWTSTRDDATWTEYQACVMSAHETGSWRMTPAEWSSLPPRSDEEAAGLQQAFDEINTWCEPWRPDAPGPVFSFIEPDG